MTADDTASDLTRLPDHPTARPPEPFAGPDHPMRTLTRAVAFGEPWTSAHAARVADLFDGLAPEWAARASDPDRTAPIADALERGDCPLDGSWLEIGSGTGIGTAVVAPLVRSLVATDLSAEMLRQAPGVAPRLRADGSMLPVRDDGVDAVLLVNMMLFPAEIDRVLRRAGALVWVNTRGDQTPIHLPQHDVLAALPGRWRATTASAGQGFWMVARRAR